MVLVGTHVVEQKEFRGVAAWYRVGSSDDDVLREILVKRIYCKPSKKFEVLPGERWLDLGANIGAFALYCKSRGASAECYEPEPECFALLQRNVPEFKCIRKAVTIERGKTVPFFVSRKAGNFTRGTTYPMQSNRPHEAGGSMPNLFAGKICSRSFSGIKLDIEGSECGLIDEWLLPKADKMVMEYHTSRDSSMANLKRRLKILRDHYEFLSYPVELDDLVKLGGSQKTWRDRNIFCWGLKE